MLPNRKRSRFDWRIIEYPSTRLRVRATCNDLKKKILGQDWSPYEPQITKLFNAMDGQFFDERTYNAWWNGAQYPTRKNILTLENLCKDSTYWLNTTPVGKPMLRFLFALDASTFGYTNKPEDFYTTRNKRIKTSYDAIHTVWALFTSDGYKPTSNILDFTQQAPKACIDTNFKANILNINSTSLPIEVRNSYRHDDPSSIFLFLIMYAGYSQLSDPHIKDVWILDMASSTLLLSSSLYDSLGYDLTRKLGNIQNLYNIYNCLFFSEKTTVEVMLNQLSVEFPDSGLAPLLRTIRKRFFDLLLQIGITMDDMRTIRTYELKNISESDVTKAGLR